MQSIPILLFITEFCNELNNSEHHGVQLTADLIELFCLIFADDIAIVSDSVVGLQRLLDKLELYCGRWSLAIVTHNQSALWTDGRYYLQAEQQLDCNWILMKSSEAETQKPWDWLIDVLPSGTIQEPILVAFDPTLISISAYNKYNKAFKSTQSAGVYIEMYSHEQNLIDIIWNDRPDCPNEPLFALDIKWTGEEWYDKVIDHREEMKKVGADIMVLHALDDTAWFFNLRGMDIPYNPVFFGYTIIEMEKTTLFVKNVEKLIVDDIHSHLLQDKNDQSAGCANIDNNHKCLHILEYDIFLPTLNNKSNESDFTKVWISTTASYGIYGNVPTMRQYSAAVPTQLMKAQKNKNEIEGMREGNIQDAVAMIEWMHWMEGAVVNAAGDIDKLSEISADKKVQEFRRKQPDFVMPSFGAISAFGPNGAVIHYSSTPDTNVAITDNNMYLLDSGGQYRCGATTDITRTMHYGEPEARHREAYTRVLQGAIDLSRSIFPEGTWGRDVDIHARQQLWNNGWNYKHGTGHGIGAMLNVHEGPQRIAYGYRAGEAALSPGMFTSDEPGYYEDHDYGVRIETVFMTTEAETPNNFDGKQYYTFEEVSFVPYEPKLIKYEMMTRQQ
uniref:Xaa-Pro aminopeptidase 1-like n=1 Tax=Saccoglossus kowalevskii TaxID=10224 RepID=A0ABM0MA35_SACKO